MNNKHTYYFSHDYNARCDQKIKRLIRKHGLLGYGIYWALIEDLYQNANALQMECEGIATDMQVHKDVIISIINDFDLFVVKDNHFGSLSVQKRIDERDAKSELARASANKRWETHANALQPECDSNAIKEKKGKEIKLKETKENKENINSVFIFWNSLKIIEHRNIEKYKPCINASLEHYKIEEIKEAMQNYKDVISSDKYYFNHAWGLDEFLTRKGGIDKFLTINKPFETYKAWEKNNDNKQRPGNGKQSVTTKTSAYTGINEKDYNEGVDF